MEITLTFAREFFDSHHAVLKWLARGGEFHRSVWQEFSRRVEVDTSSISDREVF